jgi:hypothetical protein
VKQQTPERALKDYEAVVADIRKRYPSVKKIGQQGFCESAGVGSAGQTQQGVPFDWAVRCQPLTLPHPRARRLLPAPHALLARVCCRLGESAAGRARWPRLLGARRARQLVAHLAWRTPPPATRPPRRVPPPLPFPQGGLFTALLTSGKAPAADAAVAYHASMLTPELIDRIRGPVRFEASDPKLDNQVNSTFYAYIDKVC